MIHWEGDEDTGRDDGRVVPPGLAKDQDAEITIDSTGACLLAIGLAMLVWVAIAGGVLAALWALR